MTTKNMSYQYMNRQSDLDHNLVHQFTHIRLLYNTKCRTNITDGFTVHTLNLTRNVLTGHSNNEMHGHLHISGYDRLRYTLKKNCTCIWYFLIWWHPHLGSVPQGLLTPCDNYDIQTAMGTIPPQIYYSCSSKGMGRREIFFIAWSCTTKPPELS